jgi:hypothetical protein
MNALILTILMRSIERLIIVMLSGLSIYYGYRLFLQIPTLNEVEGKFDLKDKASLYITKAGPGLFFALFGATILGLSLRYPIEYQDKIKQQSFNGVNPQALEGSSPSLPTNIDQDTLVQNRLRLESQIEFLNQLSKNQQPSPELITTKLKLMKTVWGKDWGNYEEFEIWAEKGAQDPIPQGLEKTAQFYRLGQ